MLFGWAANSLHMYYTVQLDEKSISARMAIKQKNIFNAVLLRKATLHTQCSFIYAAQNRSKTLTACALSICAYWRFFADMNFSNFLITNSRSTHVRYINADQVMTRLRKWFAIPLNIGRDRPGAQNLSLTYMFDWDNSGAETLRITHLA